MLRRGVRSRFLDDLVTHSVTTLAIETVVSIGCGLDTRPWRPDFPAALRWIEVDFPAMLDYKAAVMAPQEPKCRLERVAADLNEASAREVVFAAAGNNPGLMITEGFLSYLPAETVDALASESAAKGGIHYWMLDLASPQLERRMDMGSRTALRNVQSANHLNGLQILDALGPLRPRLLEPRQRHQRRSEHQQRKKQTTPRSSCCRRNRSACRSASAEKSQRRPLRRHNAV